MRMSYPNLTVWCLLVYWKPTMDHHQPIPIFLARFLKTSWLDPLEHNQPIIDHSKEWNRNPRHRCLNMIREIPWPAIDSLQKTKHTTFSRPPLFFLPRLLSFASRLNFKKSLDSWTWRHWWFAQPWWQNYHHHPPPTSVGWYIFLDDGCLVSQPRSSDETGISCYNLAWFLKNPKDFKGVGGFLHQPGTVFGLWYLLSAVETQTWVIHATVVCLWQNSNTSQFSSLTYATTFYIILQNRSKAA